MSIFRDFFVKEKPVFTGITRGIGGFGFGKSAAGGGGSGLTATGGTLHEDTANNRKIHVFTFPNSDDFVINSDPGSATLSVLVVAGGGGGGHYGGGGGAGSWVYVDDFPFSPGTYSVSVGDGGLSGNPANHPNSDYTSRNFITTQGAHGAPSTFGATAGSAAAIGGPYPAASIVAFGGGGGGGNNSSPVDAHHGVPLTGASQPGSIYFGSGGGAGSQNTPSSRGGGSDYSSSWPTAVPALTRDNHFQNGGGAATEGLGSPVSNNTGAGGGGAGGAGSNPTGPGLSGPGGAGKQVPSTFLPAPYSWLPNPFAGLPQSDPGFAYFAGGGSGQSDFDVLAPGGIGGGGAGGGPGQSTPGVDGRGGGGGGGAGSNQSQPGGDGVVIVSYPTA